MANAAEITTSIMRQKARRKRELTFLAIAAIMVIACVVAWLHVDGVATTGEAMCGYEEHTHTAECYELVYICGYEEGEALTPAIDYAAIEAEVRAQFEAEVAAEAQQQALALEEAQAAAAAEAEVAGEDPDEAREAVAALADPEPVIDEVALQEAIDAAYAQAEAATEVHTHSEACTEARLVCELEEHTHVPLCYSNPNIDVESPVEWEATFADVELTGRWPEDLVAIAETQIGYSESEQNFQLGDDGEHRGYTRYGDWYQNPYGVWDGLFVMFCLEYAGVDTDYLPCESGAYAWTAALQRASAYEPVHSYTPKPGDIIFFNDDYEENDKADRVGIVKSVNEDLDELVVIEGDVNNTVAETPYSLSSETIQGYCDVAARQAVAEDPGNGVIPIDEYGVEEGNQDAVDESGDGDEDGVEGVIDETANEETDNADSTDQLDGVDGADKADQTGEADKSDSNKASDNASSDNAKPDTKDPSKPDESQEATIPTPSDESEVSKIIPMYATIVNDSGEIVVFTEPEAQALAEDEADEDGSAAKGEDEPLVVDSLLADEASNAGTSQADATSSKNNEVTKSEETVENNTPRETESAPEMAPTPQDDTELRGIEEANNSTMVTPIDMGTYLTDGKVECRPVNADEDAWTLVESNGSNNVLNWDDKVKITLEYKLAAQTLSELDTTVATQVKGVEAVDPQKGDVLDEISDAKLGAYDVSDDGIIVIAFDEDSVQQNSEHAIEGSVSFECDASALAVNADNQATIQFGPMKPVTFTVVKENPAIEDDEDGEDGDGASDEADDPDKNINAILEEGDKPEAATEFVFTKIDGDTKEPLNGAVFEVYEYENGAYIPIAEVVSGKNEAAGVVKITQLKYDTAYYLQETAAPEGYEPISKPIYFDIKRESGIEQSDMDETQKFTDGAKVADEGEDKTPSASSESAQTNDMAERAVGGAEEAYPDDFAFSSDLLVNEGDGYVLANYGPRTSITVVKQWDNSEKYTNEVKIELWQVAHNSAGVQVANQRYAEYTFSASSSEGWTHTFNDLPRKGLEGDQVVTYTYYVVEPESTLYTLLGMTSSTVAHESASRENAPMVQVSKEGIVATNEDGGYENVTSISEGTITLINRYNETGYKLPASGGSGVLPYSIVGGCVIVAAAIFALTRRQGRKLS